MKGSSMISVGFQVQVQVQVQVRPSMPSRYLPYLVQWMEATPVEPRTRSPVLQSC